MDGYKSKPLLQSNIPYWLLLELTYRCPLQCPYCSNPDGSWNQAKDLELSTTEWKQVLKQARELGSVQLGLSGGEPLLRKDLEDLISYARELGLYTNLITSGVGLTPKRTAQLKEAGIDHIQLSFQAPQEELNNYIAGKNCFRTKIQAAKLIKDYQIPMVLNFVLHRLNAHLIEEMILLSQYLQADYIELANTQFYGLAKINQKHLFPTKDQIKQMEKVIHHYQNQNQNQNQDQNQNQKTEHKMKIYYILSDYYEDRPKPCSNGWGSTMMAVAPTGYVYPCLGAPILSHLSFPNVKEHLLAAIWKESHAFNFYRGEEWMQSPCRTCPERGKDFGGCRCQAYMLLGDASLTDPVCHLSPHHFLVENFVGEMQNATDINGFRQIRFRNDLSL